MHAPDTLASLATRYDQIERASAFVQLTICRALSAGPAETLHQFTQRWPRHALLDTVKAAVSPGTTGDSDWAALAAERKLATGFVDLLARQTVLGALGSAVTRAPLRLAIPITTAPAAAGWVAENAPVPASEMAFDAVTLDIKKIGSIIAVSSELAKSADGRALTIIERALSRAAATAEDTALLSDAAATSAQPAGLLSGLSSVGAGSPSQIEDDVRALLEAVRDGEPLAPFFIVSRRGAAYLALARDGAGARMFPELTTNRELVGVPVIINQAADDKLILLDAGALIVLDEGIAVVPSRSASVQLSTTPLTTASMVTTSLFQSNLIGLRVIRLLNWQLSHSDAVAFATLPLGSPS